MNNKPRVALVHDWLVSRGGAERVLKCLHEMWPEAPIYTLVYDCEKAPEWTRECDIRTTYIQKWPGARSHHKLLLSFMPKAWEALDLTGYELVVSSCASCCKGVLTRPDALHICYCHSPTSYVWDLYYDYFSSAGAVKRAFMPGIIHRIRQWDYLAAQRVDVFIANSDYVGKRIKKYYDRESITIHPGVSIPSQVEHHKGGYYLTVSRFVRYKRIDLAIEACNQLGRRLIVVGSGGEEESKLRRMAGPTIEFIGTVPDTELDRLYSNADAFLFPGIEDFGLTPVEAMAHGTPVLAYAEGGALETVKEGISGYFFANQTVESLIDVIKKFEQNSNLVNYEAIREYGSSFSVDRFKQDVMSMVKKYVVT